MRNPVRWILFVVLFVIVGVMQKTSAARSTPATSDPDVNVRLRGSGQGWKDANFFPKVLQDHAGAEPRAPQLSTLIGDTENHNPTFTYFGQVYSRSGSGLDSSNTAVPGVGSIQAGSGTTMYSPKQGYELGGGYSYVILYASPTDIVIHDTAEDSVASGYTIHLFNINVDPKLLSLYNQNESSGRAQLVAIPCHAVLGTVAGPDMRIIIRDTGSFMDVRYKDWWTQPVISNCKDIPPGLLTAPKKPPSGPILDNTTGDVPKTIIDSQPVPNVSIGNQETGQGSGFSTPDFANVTFPNFAKENNKFSEMLNPNQGGGELIPAQLQGQFENPTDQIDYGTEGPSGYVGYKEVFAAGCAQSQFEGGKPGEPKLSRDAAQAVAPDPYPDVQASFHNFAAMRVPGESSGLQWRAQQPNIITSSSGELTDRYFSLLKKCNANEDKKPVSAVSVPVTGSIQAILASVFDTVSNLWNLITNQHTVCDPNDTKHEHCQTFSNYTATLQTIKTATVFLPGSQDMEKMAVDEKEKKHGVFLTFFPNDIINKLSKVHGYTNKEGGNVLADSTDNGGNGPNDFPHYEMHAVKDTFTKTSSCMLIPASVQAQRGTKCDLEGGAAPTPSPIPTPPPDGAPRLVQTPSNPIDITAQCRYNVNNFRTTSTAGGRTLESVASFFCRYYPRACIYGERNFKQIADTIQNYASQRSYNPAFLLAMWIEESGASGLPNVGQSWAFGCRGDLRQVAPFYDPSITLNGSDVPDANKAQRHVEEQLKCITNTFDASKRFVEKTYGTNKTNLYTYTLTEWATGSYTGAFPSGPAGRISLWYNQLAGSCGTL